MKPSQIVYKDDIKNLSKYLTLFLELKDSLADELTFKGYEKRGKINYKLEVSYERDTEGDMKMYWYYLVTAFYLKSSYEAIIFDDIPTFNADEEIHEYLEDIIDHAEEKIPGHKWIETKRILHQRPVAMV